jgi:FkbM family methyltransferase
VSARKQIWENLLAAEKEARLSKFNKWIAHPIRYPALMLYNYLIYPLLRQTIPISAGTFFGKKINLRIPSGTDILLHGIKSHDSEIRLSKFLCWHLHENEVFMDVGAHYGYYSLLAATLVGPRGQVIAIEPGLQAGKILEANIRDVPTIKWLSVAVSDVTGEMTFYEFPGPYAEYSTTVGASQHDEKHTRQLKSKTRKVKTTRLDDLIRDFGFEKATIKLDVEGGELAALQGCNQALQKINITLIMEYHLTEDVHSPHKAAVAWLRQHGYVAHRITAEGYTEPAGDIDAMMREEGLMSDNLVFKK